MSWFSCWRSAARLRENGSITRSAQSITHTKQKNNKTKKEKNGKKDNRVCYALFVDSAKQKTKKDSHEKHYGMDVLFKTNVMMCFMEIG